VAPHLPWHVVHILGHGTISVPLQRPVTRCIQRDRGNPFLLGCKNTEADIVRGRLEREHRRCEYRSARSSRVRYLHLQRPRIVASTTSLDAFCIDLTGLAISRNVSKCSELAIKCSKLPRQMFGARLRTDPGSSEHLPAIGRRPGRQENVLRPDPSLIRSPFPTGPPGATVMSCGCSFVSPLSLLW